MRSRLERRRRRVLNDPLLTWERISDPVLRRLVSRRRTRRRVMTINATAQAEHLRVVTAALGYHGRAIPLVWMCWPRQAKQPNRVLEPVWARVGPGGPRAAGGRAGGGCGGSSLQLSRIYRIGWPHMAGIGWCECEEGQTRWCDRQGRIQPMIQQVTQRGDCRKGQAQVFQGGRLADASRASVAGLEPATMITPLCWVRRRQKPGAAVPRVVTAPIVE